MINKKQTIEDLLSDPKMNERLKERLYSKQGLLGKESPFSEILQSDFFKEVPLELFGINKNTLINIISEAPKKVTAFINTLIEISQNYNLGKERFYFAVVRSFQELYDNHFPDIEEKAKNFAEENQLKLGKNIDIKHLEKILIDVFDYEIKSEDFEQYGTLNHLRSLYVPEKKLLLLNRLLDENQKTFILAKEIGFQVLELNPRPNTYSWLDFTSFEELLSNFYASYFAGCILIPKDELIEKTEEFFDEPDFNSQKFDELIAHFTNSPETFYYRLTNLRQLYKLYHYRMKIHRYNGQMPLSLETQLTVSHLKVVNGFHHKPL